ncbi:MAG: DPP IV N-terminal domain-containing protein [Alloprevotella sp.]|nr:DPP IV N-terminal domain-containing protein [Alloprevotella sp.]
MKNLCAFSLALLSVFSMSISAQDKQTFTLNDLMWGGNNYWNLQPQALYTSFWGDELLHLSVEQVSRQKDGKVLFTLDEIRSTFPEDKAPRGLNLLRASFPYPEKPQVLLTAGGERFLYDWEAKEVVWHKPMIRGAQADEFNTSSRYEAYVLNNDLYLRTEAEEPHRITTDGSREIVYGQSVHRNEFGISKGTFFSPTGKLLAFYRMDQSMVADYPQVDISAREAAYVPDKYPMAGMTSHKVSVGIYNPDTRSTIYLQTGDPTDRYFSNITWSPDERTLYVIELPRSQDKAELVAYDTETGARKSVLYTETNPKYVHPTHPLLFLPWDADKFVYQSERDGYNHLYLFDTSGREVKQLTQGNYVVSDVLGFNTKTKSIIYQSNEVHPLRENLWSVNVRTGKRQLLDNGLGVHSGRLNASGTQLIDRWSEPTLYASYALRTTSKPGEQILQTDSTIWQGYDIPEVRSGSLLAADNSTPLFYRLVLPTHFDPTKKYPTVVYVYGGPGTRNVEERWRYMSRPWETYMAQRGYVIFVLDNRGSSMRGFQFESATFRHLGDVEMQDQMRGIDFLKTLSFVDSDRIGVHGWSFGGFMTTNLMLTYPEVFKVGVAGGPVIDWRYYEVMYGERYMDTPQENPEGYESSSLLNKAKNLKGRLQLIIGYNDPVCVPQHSLSFLRACEDAGTQPDFFVYPNQEHNMMGRDQVHLHERITRYFDDYLK